MVFAIAGCGFARCYVIAEEEGLLVADVGSVGTAADVVRFIIRDLGRSLQEIRYILATHFHIDHIGGIGHLLAESGGKARVAFHRRVGDYLSGAASPCRMKNWIKGLLPAAMHSAGSLRSLRHLHFESLAGVPLPGWCRLVNLPYLSDKIEYLSFDSAGRVRLGFGRWEILETPGHTQDSVCLYHQESTELISGDLILNFEQNGNGYLNPFCCDEQMVMKTYLNLCEIIRPERIYPGHGETIRGNGNALLKVRTLQ
jgi:glyoxylase-like metal-dependent hydrolase (beta-lactamase superfamily II)